MDNPQTPWTQRRFNELFLMMQQKQQLDEAIQALEQYQRKVERRIARGFNDLALMVQHKRELDEVIQVLEKCQGRGKTKD